MRQEQGGMAKRRGCQEKEVSKMGMSTGHGLWAGMAFQRCWELT